jgi:hypothetical protein
MCCRRSAVRRMGGNEMSLDEVSALATAGVANSRYGGCGVDCSRRGAGKIPLGWWELECRVASVTVEQLVSESISQSRLYQFEC